MDLPTLRVLRKILPIYQGIVLFYLRMAKCVKTYGSPKMEFLDQPVVLSLVSFWMMIMV